MNYYTDSKNGYSMNNKYEDCRHNDDYSKEFYDKDFNRNNYGQNEKHSCCVRRVEETFCCYPSYYNEEKKEDKWEDKKEEKKERCFEGTFKICPKYYDCNDKDEKNNDHKNDCDERDNQKDDHKYGCRCHNRCGFCGLFRRW